MKLLKSFCAAVLALGAVGAHAAHLSYSFVDGISSGSYVAPSFTDGVNASVRSGTVPNVYLQPEGLDAADSFLVVSKLGGSNGSARERSSKGPGDDDGTASGRRDSGKDDSGKDDSGKDDSGKDDSGADDSRRHGSGKDG